jgi:hypothetical protein
MHIAIVYLLGKFLTSATFGSLLDQSYLDEIGYRFNRRHILNRIFERCVVAMLECPIWTYWDIIGKPSILKKSRLKVA